MRFIRGVIDTLLYVLVAFVLALTVPRAFGFQYITIQSGSMLPVLQVGSACVISADRDGYKYLTRQDIITYELQGTEGESGEPLLITHRIQCINGDGTFTTKGDNNDVADTRRVDPEQIVGIVRFHVPYVGYILDNLNSTAAKGGLAVAMVVLVVLSLMLDPGDREKEEERDEDEGSPAPARRGRGRVAPVGRAAQEERASGKKKALSGPEPSGKRKKAAGGALTPEQLAAFKKGGMVPVPADVPVEDGEDVFPEVPDDMLDILDLEEPVVPEAAQKQPVSVSGAMKKGSHLAAPKAKKKAAGAAGAMSLEEALAMKAKLRGA